MRDREYRIKMALLRKTARRNSRKAIGAEPASPPQPAPPKPPEVVVTKRLNPPAPAPGIHRIMGVPVPHNSDAHNSEVHNRMVISSRRRRTPVPPANQPPVFVPAPPNPAILLTGGIGDIFAVESYFSDEQRARLSTILYATNKHEMIRPLFEALPNFPSLKNHQVVWSDFSTFWCFLYKNEVVSRLGTNAPPELHACEDWGIVTKFPRINRGNLHYNGSSFLAHTIASVSHFDLPHRYVVLAPFSTDKRQRNRDFAPHDWGTVLTWLATRDLSGVVVNRGGDKVPEHSRLVDLSNKTTVLEAVEILKKAKGYIGIDSWLSVLAAKKFDSPYLAIKSNNSHCYNNKHIYYAPKKTFEFLDGDLGKLLKT